MNALEVPPALLRDVVALRRDFHANPELGFEEVRTSRIVALRLAELGYEVRSGVGKTGVLGVLRGKHPGLTVLLRADMDALPVQEESGETFASLVPGKMHACGHDGHTAILLGAAEMIAMRKERLAGTIVLCFQPAEEGQGGAKAMIADGALENPRVDRVYGLHLWSLLETGKLAVRGGPIMASSDSIDITIRGRGGHGAAPHMSIDPIAVAAHFVTQVQSIVSRQIDPTEPAVITIGAMHGGTTHNVIPDTVRMLGTVRAFSAEVRNSLKPRIETVLRGCCEASGAAFDYDYAWRYPVTVNDPVQAEYVRGLAAQSLGSERVVDFRPIMGAEDFSFMLRERPGCFFFLGAQRAGGASVPHHNARFSIDEACLETGVQMMTALAMDAPRHA